MPFPQLSVLPDQLPSHQAFLDLATGPPSVPSPLVMEFADVLLEKTLPTFENTGARQRLIADLQPALLNLSQHILSLLSPPLALRSAQGLS